MAELSLRYIPDLSDTSAIGDFSESSFQIPATARQTDDLLLDDNTLDFFNNANDTFSTPPPPQPTVQPPLTLAELTPRPKPVRAAPIRSSLRPRPGVATPYKANVAQELSAAISEDLSPFRNQDPSFQIPSSQPHGDNILLMADDGDNFLSEEQPSLDASPRVPLSDPSPHHEFVEPLPPTERIATEVVQKSPHAIPDSGTRDPVAASTVASAPSLSDSLQETDNPTSPSKKGKVKVSSRTNLTQRRKNDPCGEKAKRKRVVPAGGSLNPAKLKPVTASLARKLSSSGKKPALTLRRRPLQGDPSETVAASSSGSMVAGSNEPSAPTVQAEVKPFQSGGLAGTLLSFGQKLIANTQKLHSSSHDLIPERREEDVDEHANEMPSVTATALHSTIPTPVHSDDNPPKHEPAHSVSDQQPAHSVGDRDYLTLSQLSPRKLGATPTSPAAMDSSGENAALAVVANHFALPSSSSSELPDGPPSQMRTSVKRAPSPAEDLPARQRKRGKTLPARQEPSSSKELRPRKPALQPSRAKNVSAAAPLGPGPTSRTGTATATAAKLPATGADRAAKRKAKSSEQPSRRPGLTASRSSSQPQGVPGGEEADGPAMRAITRSGAGKTSSQSGSSAASSAANHGRSGASVVLHGENVAEGDEMTDGSRQSRSTSASGDRPTANLPPAKPTIPQEFTFATSTRTLGRSKAAVEQQPDKLSGPGASTSSSNGNGQSLKRSRANTAGHHPIPDFKALHAAHESTMAQRRAEVHRTVPVGFDFATDARAQDRNRFEEGRRVRERELEQQAEERRRQRELEEEAEVRELRRRAVPKANEVPEWYALAPKRAKAIGGADGAAGTT
uniref:Cross-pathway control protein A n=1 Tax=Ganoderma boninense TaxID=34458 RepID=A0A5K1JXQ6_9APHY|nr:Cross-pathway control protein A [Ganoderma boninense]